MNSKKLEKMFGSTLGAIREVTQIKKGFSHEKKYLLKTASEAYLLRTSPVRALSRKQEEFGLMQTLFGAGVSCNRPVELFVSEEESIIYSLFSFLPGDDAEDTIQKFAKQTQFEIGAQAGRDLKRINSLVRGDNTWKQRKLAKHEQYLREYLQQDCRFKNDDKVTRFIALNCDIIASKPDRLQHDDFHLGNIVIADGRYSGILDFNRFDWGDPLHEFVKLEWFTWPASRDFAQGEIKGYFGEEIPGDDAWLVVSVYVAMSIFSTIVWTNKFYPDTLPFIEQRVHSILESYAYFERTRPEWAFFE